MVMNLCILERYTIYVLCTCMPTGLTVQVEITNYTVGIGWVLLASATSGFSGCVKLLCQGGSSSSVHGKSI